MRPAVIGAVGSDASVALTVAAHPLAGDRLLAGGDRYEDLTDYRAAGGYRPIADAGQLGVALERAAVRGRGGAAFPFHRKIRSVRSGPGPAVAVANGEEGEPTSVKDRWLMRRRPHQVLDGLRVAAELVGADELHVFVSDAESAASIEHAAGEAARSGVWDAPVRVTRVEPAYVAGEETAVVRALNGGPAIPSDKPPRPFECGVGGRPTLISNVETLAHAALVHRVGPDAFREVGTASSPGTFLLTLTGCCGNGLYEVPFGITLRDVLDWQERAPGGVRAALMGGYFSGVVGPEALDLALEPDLLRAAGTGLGCGAVSLLGPTDCPVAVSAAVLRYFARENAGQCGSCFNGTAAMSAVLSALVDGGADESDVARLVRWTVLLPGRGACGTLDAAVNVARNVVERFGQEVQDHLAGDCAACNIGPRPSDPPFAVAGSLLPVVPAR